VTSAPASAIGAAASATDLAVDVAFTPSAVKAGEVAVVVDVLRATSTIVQALASGFSSVHCCRTLDQARARRGPGRVLAGERNCRPLPGFELGNSPVEIAMRPGRGEELVLTTTNGSPAIAAAAQAADWVLIASLLNLDATLAAVPASGRVVIVCSGTDGAPALEDVYVAGRIVERLGGALSDSARVAACVAASYPGAREALAASADAAALVRTGQADDIDWCARESVAGIVAEARPRVGDGAVVTAINHINDSQ